MSNDQGGEETRVIPPPATRWRVTFEAGEQVYVYAADKAQACARIAAARAGGAYVEGNKLRPRKLAELGGVESVEESPLGQGKFHDERKAPGA